VGGLPDSRKRNCGAAHPTFAKSNDEWDKTFPKSEKVEHQKVTFKNRYGITLSADLYQPKDCGDKRLAAIAVSGPFGAVKEQSSGLYAQAMAERGFVTLAFDPSYTGERVVVSRVISPRRISIPRISARRWIFSIAGFR
jgi:uncharacterized protein